MTQKQILETVLSELGTIKKHMPNGELKQMQKDIEKATQDLSDLKYTLLNPDNGVIVNTNKNTEFRQNTQSEEKEIQTKLAQLESLKSWKDGVSKALWIIFASLAGLIIRALSQITGS